MLRVLRGEGWGLSGNTPISTPPTSPTHTLLCCCLCQESSSPGPLLCCGIQGGWGRLGLCLGLGLRRLCCKRRQRGLHWVLLLLVLLLLILHHGRWELLLGLEESRGGWEKGGAALVYWGTLNPLVGPKQVPRVA